MFIPLKDENPTRSKPVMTILLIIVNTVVLIYSITKTSRGFELFMFQHGLIPFAITHLTELPAGSTFGALLTPLTSMFMHGGLVHLAGNMLFLWVFGNNVEDYLGPVKYLLFYILAGLAADALFIVLSPNSQVPLVGASGAIAGVLGAYLVLFPRARILTLIFLFFFIRIVRIPAAIILGFWFFYQLLMSAAAPGGTGGVAWQAHVGGFAFGWLIFKLFVPRGSMGNRQRVYRMDWS